MCGFGFSWHFEFRNSLFQFFLSALDTELIGIWPLVLSSSRKGLGHGPYEAGCPTYSHECTVFTGMEFLKAILWEAQLLHDGLAGLIEDMHHKGASLSLEKSVQCLAVLWVCAELFGREAFIDDDHDYSKYRL